MRNVTKVRSRRKHFHMKLFNTILLVLSVTTLNKVLDMLVYLKFLKVHFCWRYHSNQGLLVVFILSYQFSFIAVSLYVSIYPNGIM